nr:hypothetical protein [Tanacetum cinerariifolium]
MLMVPFSNKSFLAFRVKSVGLTAPLEKCCEMRKHDSMSYHARDTCELAKSPVLGATLTGTGDIATIGGLKCSLNIGWNKQSQSSLGGGLQGLRDLRAKFEEFSFNSTDMVNVVNAPINAANPNSTNSTKIFNTASPSINVVSLNFGITKKSSFLDPSKYLDDPDIPELEDIVYSEDEEDVGAEANLSYASFMGFMVYQMDVKSAFLYGTIKEEYALVVNPTIYVSCIKQFWATAMIKKVNNVVQLHALIDGKKVVVSEAFLSRDLHLDDTDGVECLPNEEIFEELARIGYEKPPLNAKRTSWNEFSYSMTSAIICLAIVVIDNQVDDMTSHNTRYTSPALTQKVFANMKRVGKVFSSVKTPLFASLLVQPQPQAKEEVEVPIAPLPPALQDPTPTPHEDASKQGGKIAAIDANEGIALVDVETDKEVVAMDAETHEREDLVALWNLVQEKVSSAVPSKDKEKALWVELKRLFEPDEDDILWKLQRYMYAPLTWKLYTGFGVHHVSSTRGHGIFMLTENDYPL